MEKAPVECSSSPTVARLPTESLNFDCGKKAKIDSPSRAPYVQGGLHRAASFSWESAASDTWQYFRSPRIAERRMFDKGTKSELSPKSRLTRLFRIQLLWTGQAPPTPLTKQLNDMRVAIVHHWFLALAANGSSTPSQAFFLPLMYLLSSSTSRNFRRRYANTK